MRFTSLAATALAASVLFVGPEALGQNDPGRQRGERPQARGQNQGQNQDQNPARNQRARGQAVSPEQLEVAWSWEARGVAARLGLDHDTAVKLEKTYTDARKAIAAELAERVAQRNAERGNRQGPGRQGQGAGQGQGPGGNQAAPPARQRGGGRGMLSQLNEEQRDQMATAFMDFLDEAQTKKAMAVLGTFDRQYDMLVHTVATFGLGHDQTLAALAPIEVYVTDMTVARTSTERDLRGAAIREARDKLQAAMKPMLDDAQMEKLQQALGGGAAGRRGPSGFADRLREMDANGDGTISSDEVPERMQRLFDRLDTNGDGVIDEQEIEAAANMGRRGGRRGPGGGGNEP